jgi:hypothetical protein
MTSTAEETLTRLKEKAEAQAGEEEQETFEEVEEEVEEETKKHGDSTREYVVLANWAEAGRITASSSKAAIESLPEGAVKNGAKYVAVPVRNWNEHEIVVETKTTITIK